MRNDHAEDLDWLAFLYVANELGSSEREAFEEQLVLDQTAREAVARAVELSQTLAAAKELDEIMVRATGTPARDDAPAPSASHRAVWSSGSSWKSGVAWMGVGAAACLALVAAWAFVLPGLQNVSGVVSTDWQVLELARAWSSARQEYNAREEYADQEETIWDRDFARGQQLSTDASSGNLAGDDALDLAGVPAPSWMLTAVAGEVEASGSISGRAGDHERTNEIREN